MSLNDLEQKRTERAVERFMNKRRPPPHIRPKLDLGYRIENQSLVLYEIRPRWNEPEEILELPFAKTTYVRSRNIWKIFWQRADLKWHAYQPCSEVDKVEEFLEIVDADVYACFFG